MKIIIIIKYGLNIIFKTYSIEKLLYHYVHNINII